MKTEYLDWSILRVPAIIFAIALLVGIAIVGGSYYYMQSMEREFTRSQSVFRSISSQYLQVDEEEDMIRSYYPDFVELYREGLLGKERRLDWIETLQSVSETLEIPSLRYEISSQEAVPGEFPIDTGRYQIYKSVMEINMDMLHEADLIRFLDRIDIAAEGLFSVSDCSMTRKSRGIDLQSEQPNVTAECHLSWYSIKPADGSEIVL